MEMEQLQTHLYLLGSPYLERNGARIEFDTRKALAMLAYLIITGIPQQRDALATLFWPENDQPGARAALRRTLSVLKAGLSEGALTINREQIYIQPANNFWCDALDFQRLADLAEGYPEDHIGNFQDYVDILEQAATLYRGDFLTGFSLRDSTAFDDWQYLQSEHFRQEFASVLQKLTLAYSSLGSFQHAINSARRWLALDPLREEAHRQLMLCYSWFGQRTAALQQYRTCVRILEEELGVPPLEETTQLYHALLEQRTPPPPKIIGQRNRLPESPSLPIESTVSDRNSLLPLVGRSRETEILLRTYQRQSQNGHLCVIQGEPGVGKTRLAEEFLSFARSQGARFLSARSYSGESSLAYAPFSDALRSAAQRVDLRAALDNLPAVYRNEVIRLIPELNTPLSPSQPIELIDQPGTETILYEGIRQVILKLVEGKQPGILLLDDFHLADSASMSFFLYLVRRMKEHAILLLVTVSNEALPDPLNQIIYESQRADKCTIIELHRLQRAELIDLIRTKALPTKNSLPNLVERVYRETEGLPFFVVEYLQLITESGEYLTDSSSEWPMPGNVQNLLRTRLKGLDETAIQILTTAAVIGRSFDFSTLVDASGRSETEALNGLERLLASRIIEEISSIETGPGNVYDFTHDKLRQLVYEGTNFSRRRLLHRRVAEALTRQYRSKPGTAAQLSQIAHHFQLGGLEVLAAENYKSAGDHALSVYAHIEAIHHYQSALAFKYPNAAEIHEILGDLYTRMGEFNQAIASYQTAAALIEADPQPRLEHKLANLYHRIGNFDLAICHFQSALDLLHEQNRIEDLALLYADWSRTAFRLGDTFKAQEYAHQSLELTQATGSSRAYTKAHNILGILARSAGRLNQAGENFQASLEAAQAIGDLAGEAAALNNLALLAGDNRDYLEAIQKSHAALEICQHIGDRHHEAALLNHLSELYHAQGEEDLAMEYLKKAVRIFAEIGLADGKLSPEIWMLSEW